MLKFSLSHVSHSGPIACDLGIALVFPAGYIIAHCIKGQSEAKQQSSEVFINSLLDTDCYQRIEAGRTAKERTKILHNIVGTCGMVLYLLPYYILYIHSTFFPIDAKNKSHHHDTLGILGLNLMHLTYDTNYISDLAGVDEIRLLFASLREEGVDKAQQDCLL